MSQAKSEIAQTRRLKQMKAFQLEIARATKIGQLLTKSGYK